MGKKRLIEGKIVDDEKIGYTRICMLRAFGRLGPRGRRSGREGEPAKATTNTGGEGEPATETTNTGLRGSETNPKDYQKKRKPAIETVNVGLPGSETNPELRGVIGGAGLASLIEKIQALVQQGELSWKEVYVLFEKIFNTLEAKLKTTREKAIFGFRKSLDALREKIAEISTNLSREVFGQITGSKMFKQLIMKIFASIIVGVLVFSPITSAFAGSQNSAYLSGVVNQSKVTASTASNHTFHDGSSNFSYSNTIGIEAYEVGTGDLEVDKEPFDLEQALKKLESYPNLLIDAVLDIIKLVDKNDPRPLFTSLVSLTINGKQIHGPFSEGVFVLEEEGVLVPFAKGRGNILQEIGSTSGIIYFHPTYIDEGSGQFLLGGSTVFDGHCCGSGEYGVFENLQSLQPGDEITITVIGPDTQKANKFTVKAVQAVPKEYSSDMFSYDLEKIKKFFARVALGLEIDYENPNWEQALSGPHQQALLELVERHIKGEYVFFRTCDSSLLVRDRNGLTSNGRIVVIAEVQEETDFIRPNFFIRPNLVIPMTEEGGVDISDEGKKEVIKQFIRAIYKLYERYHERYPNIVQDVQEILQEKLQAIEEAEPLQRQSATPTPSSESLTSANSQSPQTSSPTPTSYSHSNSDPKPDQSSSRPQQEVGSFNKQIIEAVKSLNNNLNNNPELAKILPIIPFHSGMETVDIQAWTNKINKSELSWVRLVEYFLFNQHHLGLLSDYIQVLDQLVEELGGKSVEESVNKSQVVYKDILEDFVHKLRLTELIVGRLLPAGIVSIIVILVFFYYLKRRS